MDVMYYVVSFVLPLLLLALFNAKLMMAYRQFRKKRRILRPTQLNARFASVYPSVCLSIYLFIHPSLASAL